MLLIPNVCQKETVEMCPQLNMNEYIKITKEK